MKSQTESWDHALVHRLQRPAALQRELVAGLRARVLPAKFLYSSAEQSRRWVALHHSHAPKTTGGASIYEQLAAQIPRLFGSGQSLTLLSLCAGPAAKEYVIASKLVASGHTIRFVPVDVSLPLLLDAMENLRAISSEATAICADIAHRPELDPLLPTTTPRLVSCFGSLHNFEPAGALAYIRTLLRVGDWFVFGVNLAPGPDYIAAMQRILPQYANPQTKHWIAALFEELNVPADYSSVEIRIEDSPVTPGLKRFTGAQVFLRDTTLTLENEAIEFRAGESVALFYSHRFTVETIGMLLRAAHLELTASFTRDSGEEGVFVCRPI